MEVSGYHQLFGYQRAEALIHMFYILIVKAFVNVLYDSAVLESLQISQICELIILIY